MKDSKVSEKKAGSLSAQRGKEAASLTKDGLGVADQPLMSIVQRAGCSGCVPPMQSLAGGMMHLPVSQRRTAAMSLQRSRGNRFVQRMAVQAKREPNRTGMSDRLKDGIESLSGIDMSDVRVHANSDRPSKLGAMAYTKGNQIYLGPGQERHLPHEAWHVVQQMQGRVRATMQLKDGFQVNDDEGLEHEADVMGIKALVNASLFPHMGTEEPASTPYHLQPSFGPHKVDGVQAFVDVEKATQRRVGGSAAPIQMNWIWNGSKWESDAHDKEDTRPPFKGKQNRQVAYTTPQEVEQGPKGEAGKHKQMMIKPYLDLIDHLAGEEKNKDEVSGGHLLRAMQDKWKGKLTVNGKRNEAEVWGCQWTIEKRKLKNSTMFPSLWDTSKLRTELEGFTSVGKSITLKSGIEIEKKGDTFFPVSS
jgi:hypothetical protein